MRLRFSSLALAAAVVLAANSPQSEPNRKPAPRDKPFLLLDDGPETGPSATPGADNSRCQVCHLNLGQEELAVAHAKANVSCAKCHGDCDAHIADESWASGGNGTAPDRMYPRDKINPFCVTCHVREKLNKEAHKDILADPNIKKTCTDCHGKHRLATRKCKWK